MDILAGQDDFLINLIEECKKLFLVHLSEREYFAIPKNLKLLVVPLLELYDNIQEWATILESMERPHLLVIPYPTQGHVMPLVELSHRLVDHGFKITFVNTEFNHKRIVASASTSEDIITLVSIPDGMAPGEDRKELGKLIDKMLQVMPRHLEDLIRGINESDCRNDKIKCVVADKNMGWVFEVAEKMGIQKAAFWPASGGLLALTLHIPKLIEDGIIDANGVPYHNQMIQLSPAMPAMDTAHFVWLCIGEASIQKTMFDLIVQNTEHVKLADYLICNSFYELEPSVFKLVPNLRPIGPLFASSRLANFWFEDASCLSWLDQQQAHSVIYAAFGSLTVLDKRQFEELALGLELCGQPFLWVVRPDLTSGQTQVYPDGFEERLGLRGRMVSWAPQREVLAHPSVGCFLSHCGWNSTMEGISQGVPFLCWPSFADQFLNQSYICDIWKVGLSFEKDEQNGLISKEEIRKKVITLIEDEEIKGNSLKWKETAMKNVSDDGPSLKNFEDFLQGMK